LKRSFFRMSIILTAFALMLVTFPSMAVAGVSEYQVQFAPTDTAGTGVFIVNVILSPDTKLPAKVRVPLPAGSTLLWSGEILGGDVADDPSREASVTAVADGLVVEFTLEKVLIAQVEAQWKAPTVAGSKVSSELEWINTTDAGTYTFAVRLPAGATDVEITPDPEGEPNRNAAGETLYTLTPLRLEEGGKLPISVNYRTGEASAPGLFDNMSPFLIAALALLALAIIALVVVIVRQSAGQRERASAPTAGRGSGHIPESSVDSARGAAKQADDTPDEEPEDEAFTWE